MEQPLIQSGSLEHSANQCLVLIFFNDNPTHFTRAGNTIPLHLHHSRVNIRSVLTTLRWSRPMWRTGVRFATPVRHYVAAQKNVQRFQCFMRFSCSEIVHRKNENTWLLVWPHPLEREHLRKRESASIITMLAGSKSQLTGSSELVAFFLR